MERFTLMTAFLLLYFFNFAQIPKYLEMMDDESYNFYEVVDSANAYFERNGSGKGSGYTPFMRWVNENESKFYPTGDRRVNYFLATEAAEKIQKNNPQIKYKNQSSWKDLGPYDANDITTGYNPGIGRVETFWINPNNDDTMYLGSRSGGFWRTFDGGKTWQNTTDLLPASGVFSLSVNPFNHAEILIAVQQGGNNNSHGIYRSTNYGTTWTVTNFNPSNMTFGGLGRSHRVFQISYHPKAANQVFLATSVGLYYSYDNLQTFSHSNVLQQSIFNIAFHPTKNNKLYITGTHADYQNKVYISEDAGQSFTNFTVPGNNRQKLLLSTSPAKPENVYVASTGGVWKSNDEGKTYTFLSNPDSNCEGFSVSDKDTMDMIYGYVDPYASTNGGLTFRKTSSWNIRDDAYVHADIRATGIVNGVMYLGTDGYLARSFDKGIKWEWVNDGTGIREFYSFGLCQGNKDIQMAGSQDNGTSILIANGWIEWNGGDGMEAVVHPLNPDWMIGSWQYGSRNYTRNGGLNRPGCNNPEKGSGQAAWEAPFLMNPLNSMEVFHFGSNVFKGTNFGLEWSPMGSPNIGIISEAAMAHNNPNIIAVATNSNIRLTLDGGASFNNIRSNLPNHSITDIAFDPKNDSVIIVTYNRFQNDGQKIYITKNLGQSWENITYNLGNMPLRCGIIDHSDSSYIFVGAEIGVYYKSMNGTIWHPFMEGLPNVTVRDFQIHYGTNTLRAATWGRGLWDIPLPQTEMLPKIAYVTMDDLPTESSPIYSKPQKIRAQIASSSNLLEVFVKWSKNNIDLDQEIKMVRKNDDWWESEFALIGGNEDFIHFKIFAKNENGTSESYRFNFKYGTKNYCIARGGNNTTADHIIEVTLAGKSHQSAQEYYGDFTNVVFDLKENQTYEMEVKMRYSWPEDLAFAWIDYNDNGQFERTELIEFLPFDANHVAKVTFTTPEILADNLVRMRVRSQWSNVIPTPCGEITGEVEDYSIQLTKTVNIEKTKQLQGLLFPNPNQNQFKIALPTPTNIPHVKILALDGKEVSNYTNIASNTWISHQLPSGIYLVTIQLEDFSVYQKMVVSR